MLGLDKVVLVQVIVRLPPKVRGKVPGTHLQLTPSLFDLLENELGVEGLAQAVVKDVIAILQSEHKTFPQLVVVLVRAKIVEQLFAAQLREAIHKELEVLANVLKLPAHIKLVKVLAMGFPGLGIVLVAHVLRRGLLGALVLGTRRGKVDEIFAPELRLNQGLIVVEEIRVYTRSFSNFHQQVALPLPQFMCLEEEVDGKT